MQKQTIHMSAFRFKHLLYYCNDCPFHINKKLLQTLTTRSLFSSRQSPIIRHCPKLLCWLSKYFFFQMLEHFVHHGLINHIPCLMKSCVRWQISNCDFKTLFQSAHVHYNNEN